MTEFGAWEERKEQMKAEREVDREPNIYAVPLKDRKKYALRGGLAKSKLSNKLNQKNVRKRRKK